MSDEIERMQSAERKLHDAKLGSAIENAAAKLPEHWTIQLTLERGGYGLDLVNPDGGLVSFDHGDDLADAIRCATEKAGEV